jgi:elongation factor G
MHANHRKQVGHMGPGDVVALSGVKSAITGDTLCEAAHPIELETFKFPEPVIMVAISVSSGEERDRLRRAVKRLCDEDPTLISQIDPETGEEILSGMGELHLEIIVDRLRTEFGIIAHVSQPQVSYRETIRKTAEVTGLYQKQTGGHGHFAKVHLLIEPLEGGESFLFDCTAPTAEIPKPYVRFVELGVREALEKGVIAGYPITDVRVTILGGKSHGVDSSGADFHIAGSMAVRQAVRKTNPTLLEPVMRIDVNVGEKHLGAVTADIGRRRGKVKAMQVRNNACSVSGEVPLAEVRGYATDLRSLTQGRCTFTLEFLRYALVPDTITETIINQRRSDGKILKR